MRIFIIAILSFILTTSPAFADRDYSERMRYRNATVKGQILMGMTAKEVRKAWGRPAKINSSMGRYGTSDQWVYDRPSGREYIYLDNGEVTGRN